MRALLFAVAFALTATAQTQSVALIVSMTCDATYGASGSTGTLNGHCSGLVQPYGMASMTLALTGGLNAKGDVVSVGGTMSFSLGGGLAFTAAIQSAVCGALGLAAATYTTTYSQPRSNPLRREQHQRAF